MSIADRAIGVTSAERPVRPRPLTIGVARRVWVVLALAVTALFVAGIRVTWDDLHHPCAPPACRLFELTAAGLANLAQQGLSIDAYAGCVIGASVVYALVWFALAARILWRDPPDRMSLLAPFVLLLAGADSGVMATLAAAGTQWTGATTVLEFVGWIVVVPFLYTFPTGHFLPRWTLWFALVEAADEMVAMVAKLARWPGSLQGALLLVWAVALLAVPVVQAYRYRRVYTEVQRQQTKWAVLGFAGAVIGQTIIAAYLIVDPTGSRASPQAQLVGIFGFDTVVLLIPITIAIAILRYRLWDIDLIVTRALVYGTLTAGVITLYVLLVGYLGSLLRTGGNLGISLLATGVVAVLFQPARERVQRGVNHLMYGEQDDPYAVLSRLGRQLEGTVATDAVLPLVVATVTQALKLPYAAVAIDQQGTSTIIASAGSSTDSLLTLPLAYQGEAIGTLMVAPRAGERSFSDADRRLLADLARQAGAAAHAVRLATELQRSRERLVSAREEERRRLRRDLHDGLGPALSGVMLKITTARRLLEPRSPAAPLLREVRDDVQGSVSDIRRLVYDLRPPALDELGLVGAIRDGALACEADGRRVIVTAPECLPSLPAAVEVAAYRIVQEALTNAVRHARCRTCTVRLAVRDGLEVEIMDDGVGLPSARPIGVGLTSMRERAAELGGACTVDTMPEGGTRVWASLPLCGG